MTDVRDKTFFKVSTAWTQCGKTNHWWSS